MITKRRFILNVSAKVVHQVIELDGKRYSLEQCNVDAIEKKRYVDDYPQSYKPCSHCMVPEVTTFAP